MFEDLLFTRVAFQPMKFGGVADGQRQFFGVERLGQVTKSASLQRFARARQPPSPASENDGLGLRRLGFDTLHQLNTKRPRFFFRARRQQIINQRDLVGTFSL